MFTDTLIYHSAMGTLYWYFRLRLAIWNSRSLKHDLWYYLEALEPAVEPFLFELPFLTRRGLPLLRKMDIVHFPKHLEPTPTLKRHMRKQRLVEVAAVLLAYDLLDREHVSTLERAVQEMLDFKEQVC